jgi:hypothetical protein
LREEITELRELDGGAKGDRTPDLGIANAALSQLSYRPFGHGQANVPGRLKVAAM